MSFAASAINSTKGRCPVVIQVLASLRPLSRRLDGCARVLVAALLGSIAACSSAPVVKPASPEAAQVPSFLPGVAVEREVAAGATDVCELRLAAGTYLELTVDQSELDVAVALAGPDGVTLVAVNDPGHRDRAERIAVIAPAAGSYRLAVSPAGVLESGGRYRVTVKQSRPAGPGDEDRVVAERLFAEGRSLSTRGAASWGRAVELFRQALERWQAAGDEAGQVRALVEMGATEPFESNSSAAANWLERALALARQIGDEEEQARALSTLGNIQSRPDAALEDFRQALDLWTRLGSASGEGKTLLAMALVHLDLPHDEAARGLLERAIPLLHQAEELGREATALIALGEIHVARGEIGEALRYINDALALSRKAGDSSAEASALYNLANVQRLRGELQQALGGFEQALEINRRLGEDTGTFSALYALGSIYFDLGDLVKAREKYEEALKTAQSLEGTAPSRARLLNNIGLVLYQQDQRAVALDYFQRALTLSRESKDPDAIAAAFLNLGVAEVALGHPGEGLENLRQALALRQGGNPYYWAHTLRELGTAYDRLGDLTAAERYFHDSLEMAKRVGSPGQVAEILFRWALLDREQGRLEEALAKIKEALQLVETVRNRVEIDALRTSFFASKRDYYELYINLLMHLHQLHPQGTYQVEALAASEQARARGLLDLLAEGRIELRQGITPALRQKEKDVSSRLSWFFEGLPGVTQDSSARVSEQLSQVEAEMGRLESEVEEQSPQYAELRYPKPLELDSIRGLLDADTALLEYFVGRDESVLFVVTRDGLTSYVLPSGRELSGLVEKVRSLIEQYSELEIGDFRRQSSKLYRLLVGPAAKVLAGKHSLLIAPDGPLYVFPFEVLLAGETTGLSYPDLPYLLRQHAVSYVPSASVLKGLREAEAREPPREPQEKAFVAFANPLVNGGLNGGQAGPRTDPIRGSTETEHRSFPPLLYSEEEVRAIARLFAGDQVELYLGGNATKENVLDNPLVESARRVHFATHGFVDEARPERSALVLTPSAGQDGYLTVAEIFNMKLRADLLVLSACETGLGKEVGGEGIVGLTRAFLYAGAKSLIVSLWPVVDRPTADLMQNFYRSLDATGSKVEALRKAKLDMIRGGQANPYLWAPFILSGDLR
jgi:CHAT domain-containing protein/tetratricopeptide (TPR) repeat protein